MGLSARWWWPRALAAGLLLVASLSACGGSDHPAASAKPPPPSASTTIPVPRGISLTRPGVRLDLGESATVPYSVSDHKATIAELRVIRVRKGRTRDLRDFVLNARIRRSTPYYVKATMTNVGRGNIAGSPVPLYGVDSTDTLLPAASLTGRFAKCPSQRTPRPFRHGATVRTCLLFLAPPHTTMTGVEFRQNDATAPIVWPLIHQ